MAPAKTYVIKTQLSHIWKIGTFWKMGKLGTRRKKTVELLFEIKTITIVCIRYLAP